MRKKKLNDAIRKYGRNLIHMEEVLDMLEVLSGDRHYEKLKALYYREEKAGKKVEDVCLLLDMYWNDGVERGMERGMEQGRMAGENKLAKLMNELLLAGRVADAQKAAVDAECRKQFYRELGIID